MASCQTGPPSLRMQLQAAEASGELALRIANNEASDSSMQVYWQQAWGGSEDGNDLAQALANAGHVRVTDTELTGTYNWAVNALGIKAASRFQLPVTCPRFE